jgi:TPP-dependent 2-oxoacid decarboxylase
MLTDLQSVVLNNDGYTVERLIHGKDAPYVYIALPQHLTRLLT